MSRRRKTAQLEGIRILEWSAARVTRSAIGGFLVSYADRISSNIPLPQCWGLFYEEDQADCRGCMKSASCRAQFIANRDLNRGRPIVVSSSQPSTMSQARQTQQQQNYYSPPPQQGYAYHYMEQKKMDYVPKPGEGYGERLGKNILASIIQTICKEIFGFFNEYRW